MEFAPLWFALLIPLIAFAVALMLGLLLANTGSYAPRPAISSNKREVRTGTYYANNNRRDIPPGSPRVFCEARVEFAVAARDQVQTGTASTRRDRV